MIGTDGVKGPEALREIAAAEWTLRCRVELEAEARFARLADRMEQLGAAGDLVELARAASADERRHAALCAEEAAFLGERVAIEPVKEVAEIAPSTLSFRDRVLYEVVAACCVTETESMGVLSTLLDAARPPGVRRTLHELATDEVRHARLGWAYLAAAARSGSVAFLGPFVPAMLEGSVAPDLWEPAAGALEDEGLLDLGVLPRSLRREVFERTLEGVIFPGLEELGVDSGPARRWLASRREVGRRR